MKNLNGLKVVGLVMNLPGPLTLFRLAEMGAETVKIEPMAGDALERFFPDFYAKLSQGQSVVRMDLNDREKLSEILKDADLLVTSMRPRSLKKIGLDWPELHERFPKLSHLAMTGYGGDDADWSGHDLTYQAMKGFVRPPEMPMNCWSDLAGAQEAVIQSLLLLKSEQSARVEVSLSEALEFYRLPIDYGMFGPNGALTGEVPLYQNYQAKEGWISLAILEMHFQKKFKELSQIDELDTESLATLFKQRTAAEWETWAKSHDLPLVMVRDGGNKEML